MEIAKTQHSCGSTAASTAHIVDSWMDAVCMDRCKVLEVLGLRYSEDSENKYCLPDSKKTCVSLL